MIKLLAFFLIAIFFPLVLVIALLIKLNYPGPIFYSQVREGKNGKPFRILKLRTMVNDSHLILEKLLEADATIAKSWLATGVITNDPRIAGFLGRLSRQLSIDEIPQLINVLKGEMAFIGPRPLEIQTLEQLNPASRLLRSSVLPGITGLMQVRFRNASIRQMLFYDRVYIKNHNIFMDTYILYQTIFAVFKRTGK